MRSYGTETKLILRKMSRGIWGVACLLFLSTSTFAQTDLSIYGEMNAAELQALADSGDMHAVFTQGYNMIFDDEMSVRPDPDFEVAKALLKKANAGGHDTANSILMLFYQGEFGHEPELDKLEAMLFTSAERGSAIAKLNYAHRFIQSENADKSKRALRYLKHASEDDVVQENAYPFLIEVLYGANFDTHQDWPLARKKAIECAAFWPEYAFCHYILARDFANGWGGGVNLSKSDFHFLKAAEAGDARAQWQVGMSFLNGDRVEKNEKTAFDWVKKSAEQEYHDGLISFAVMNALGQGTQTDTTAAFKAYETAASMGSGHAIRGLGSMYCAGEAPKADKDLCAAALILAFELDDDQAPALLNHFFEITDQAGFDALKKKTAPQRATLISRYNVQL